jgi:NAD kinase
MIENKKILVVRKMSAYEYYYKFKSADPLLKEGHEGHSKSVEQIEEILRNHGKQFDVVTRDALSEEFVSKYDSVISAGGDGTVIAVASYNKDKPQLNLKSEKHSIGALCQEDIQKSLENFLSGNYHIQNWTREDIFLDGKLVARASNEVCIGEKLRFDKYSKYKISYIDKNSGLGLEEEQGGSGVIVVTGTGSTAWPAVFEPFPRDSSYFKFKTLLLHNGKTDSAEVLTLNLEYRGHEGKFSIDTLEHNLPRNSLLKIRVSENPLRVIIPNKMEEETK